MTPTETLKHEHQVILMVLVGAEREAQHICETGKVDADKVRQMLDFFRTFADRCHHAKEEKLLFKKMVEHGLPGDTGPIAMMLHEHELGRARLRAVDEALPGAIQGDKAEAEVVADNLDGYAKLLRQHIAKEDEVLYPMADQLLTDEDQQALGEAFEKVEAEEMGEGTHERYHEMAHKLAD